MLDSDIVKTAIVLGIIGSALPQDASALAVHTNYFTDSHGSY